MLPYVGTIGHAVLAADVTLFKIINAHHTAFLDGFFLCASVLGNGWIVIPLFFALILRRTLKSGNFNILIYVAVALSINGASNGILKHYVGRPRPPAYFISPEAKAPPENGSPFVVHVVGHGLQDYSFPSGHTQTAFALVTLVVLIFGPRFWPVFLVAATVAFSRVYIGVHFPLDVLAGAFLGCAIVVVTWRGAAIFAPAKPS
jgi:membrane-associated phospholipid phosphatase